MSMRTGGIFRRRSGCTFRAIQFAVFLFAFYVFRHEIGLIWDLVRGLGSFVMGTPMNLPPAGALLSEVLYISLNIASYLLFGYLMVYLIGGNLLPVQNASERGEAMRRFYRFFTGERRPVIRVHEGELVHELPPGKGVSGGIAIVDPNSAIVLERTSMPADSQHALARVGRPGLVFISPGERLRGVVSLRKQARANSDVFAQTSDGIELKTTVSAVFTLGQPAAVAKVAYAGEPRPFNLRVLQIDTATRKITAVRDELDEDDQREIHHYAQQFLTFSEPIGALEPDDAGRDFPPYPIDDQHIIAAVYSFARKHGEEQVAMWTDLPPLVATEIFRNMISKERYDALFLADEADLAALGHKPPGKFRLQAELKPEFARRVRYQGVMSYQFIHHTGGRPVVEGLRVDNRIFRISPVQELRNSKVLRDRGIKIIGAGFSELTPTDPKVYEQRLDNWSAHWQQRADQIRAGSERQAIHIKKQARSEARRELTRQLSDLVQGGALSDETVRLRLIQMLQEMAVQPTTRQFLPVDSYNLAQTLKMMLAPNPRAGFGPGDEHSPSSSDDRSEDSRPGPTGGDQPPSLTSGKGQG